MHIGRCEPSAGPCMGWKPKMKPSFAAEVFVVRKNVVVVGVVALLDVYQRGPKRRGS